MDAEFLRNLQEISNERGGEIEITLDDGSTFTTNNLIVDDSENEVLVGLETGSPSSLAIFSLSRIHHIILKSQHKKKIGFRLEDLPSLNKPQELSENHQEKKEK